MNNSGNNRRSSLRLKSKLINSKNNNNNNNDKSLTATATSSDYEADTSSISISSENVNNKEKFPMILRSNLLMNNNNNNNSTTNNKNKFIKIGKITDKKLRLRTKKHVKNNKFLAKTKKNRRIAATKKKAKKAKACLTVDSSQTETTESNNNNDDNDDEDEDNEEEMTEMLTTSNSVVHQMLPEPVVLLTNIENPPIHTLSTSELKFQLKKATVKFNKACRQLTLLDQHMSDLQNSYSNAVENDRKTFKIVFRMQLATLEGTHNAYIEYIERQVERIKKLKQLLFTESTGISNHL